MDEPGENNSLEAIPATEPVKFVESLFGVAA